MVRNLSIDLIKIIAMYSVLALHLFFAISSQKCILMQYWYGIWGIAIPLFWMVSGYLLCKKNLTYLYVCKKVYGIIKYVSIIVTIYIFKDILLHRSINYSLFLCFFQKGELWVFWYFGAMIIVYITSPLIQGAIKNNHKWILVSILFLISTIFFILDIIYKFEKTYICQTFRIWYWCLYFALGMIIQEYQLIFLKVAKYKYLFFSFVLFLFTYKYVNVGGNEYLFGSPTCIAYSVLTFLCCLKIKIHNRSFISNMSSCFIVIYTFHPSIYKLYRITLFPIINNTISEPNALVLTNFFIVALIVTGFGLTIMHFNISKMIFKI